MNSLTTNDQENVEIAWIDENNEHQIRRSYLKKEFISQLFKTDKPGLPLLDEKEAKGNSLVIRVTAHECKRFLYVKFYPEYPLRQEFVDEFCYRLSGFGSFTKIVKLRHLKSDMSYCVLISEPLGEEGCENLEDIKSDQDELDIDNNLNGFYFTWNFFETFLLQPRDNKEDNVSANRMPNQGGYVYTSFDADLTLGHKLNSSIDIQPNVYSIVYLSNRMDKPCHPAVLKALVKLDFNKILLEILEGLKEKYKYLIESKSNCEYECLFSSKEFSLMKKLQSKGKVKGYKVTCFLDLCFSNTDLIYLYERIFKLKICAKNIPTDSRQHEIAILDIYNKAFNELTHFDLLHELDTIDHGFYKKAFDEANTIRKRFHFLPAVKDNFMLVKSDDNRKVYATSMRPAGLMQTLINKQKTDDFETLNELSSQIEELEEYMNFKDLIASSENSFNFMNTNTTEFSRFESIDWSQITSEQTKSLIALMRDSKEIENICFKNCSLLDESDLKTILKSNYESLKAISIQNCEKIKEFDFFDESRKESTLKIFSAKTNFSKKFEILFLSRLQFKLIRTASLLNVSCLYLCNLDQLESIEILNTSFDECFRLKELHIEYCSALKTLDIDIATLKKIILNGLNELEHISLNYRNLKYNFESEFYLIKDADFEKESFQISFISSDEVLKKEKVINVYRLNKEDSLSNGWKFILSRNESMYLDKFFQDKNAPKIGKTLKGHSGWVSLLFLLSNGNLVSASNDCTIKIWSTQTGKELHSLKGHSGYINSFVLLLDGISLASASNDSTIKIWSTQTGKELTVLKGHSLAVMSLVLLTNGNLASASWDTTIRIWNTQTGKELNVLKGHGDCIESLIELPNGNLASASNDILIWNTLTGKNLNVLKGHSGPVFRLLLLSNGNLASASNDIRIWNTQTGKELKVLNGHSGKINSLILLPNGNVASSSRDKTIIVWDIQTGNEVNVLKGHTGSVFSLVLLPNGNIVSSSRDKTIIVWDIQTGKELNVLNGHSDSVNSLVLLSNGNLVSGSSDETIIIWLFKNEHFSINI